MANDHGFVYSALFVLLLLITTYETKGNEVILKTLKEGKISVHVGMELFSSKDILKI